jgi:hypothetical protein
VGFELFIVGRLLAILTLFFFASYPTFVSIIYMDGVLVSLCLILILTPSLAPHTNPFILSFIKENGLRFVLFLSSKWKNPHHYKICI